MIFVCILQKGVGEKAVNQLEKSVSSKLEASLARQIQAQFQTSGKQALQVIFISLKIKFYNLYCSVSS